MITKVIRLCKIHEKDIILAAVIVLIAVISFGLGRLSKIRENNAPLTIENLKMKVADTSGDKIINEVNTQKNFVASKNGKKYHYVWCDSAGGIKKENKIFFATKEEAQTAGYEPAANCKGL